MCMGSLVTGRKKVDNSPMNDGSDYPHQPRVAVGAVVFKDQRVLLVQRGKAPAQGLWSIPGGSVQLGERLTEAAEREIFEEAGIVIKAGEPVFTFDLVERDDQGRVKFHYLIVDVKAEYVSGGLRSGDDAVDARWVSAEELKTLQVSSLTIKVLRDHFQFGDP